MSTNYLNSMINKEPTHKFVDIKPGDKNLEFIFIVLE